MTHMERYQIKSNQITNHSTSALVSEILMSVLQTVQKKQQQFTYGQYIFTDCTEDNVQIHCGEGGVVQRSLQREKDSGDSGK